jgi:DNA-binding XRE family transcriptional regulator
MDTKSWTKIKDDVYGAKGTPRRDELDRNYESFKIGLLLRQARENMNMTQTTLANKVEKKREFISRIENNSSNLTLQTLFDIVEKGLGGEIHISIKV